MPYEQIRHIVDHVWPTPHPPAVQPLHPNEKRALAKGHRLRLSFPTTKPTPTWIILHEIAHALTCGRGHGPDFVGAYVHLLHQHLKVPLLEMHHTLRMEGVAFSTCVEFNLSGSYL